MKHQVRDHPIFSITCDEELEAMVFLQLIKRGRQVISEGKCHGALGFFAEMEKDG
ncbi:hypothetical protein [Chlorobium phaeobacteroides]|jgi:hypothetical protein|uniref:hypothetical protein n=1 Tax=Chlorobium phaeobacteroides TaxID=1096 RepID=UPI00167F59DB|nr:hypothetical protein [Chlorobium phaeobacteroides]MBV5328369.1 hypothetical protein [Chlorobium sp.]